MITFDIFLIGLLVISTLTSLVTEAVKKILVELKVNYYPNVLAGIIATVLSGAVGASYVILTELNFTAQIIVCIIALVFMSWLCAMVGYDKVIGQFKNIKKEDE